MKQIPLLRIDIRNQSEEEAVIDINSDIGFDLKTWMEGGKQEATKKSISDKLKEISTLKTKKIIVNISSLGGSVSDGLAIHDMLAHHSAQVETNVIGLTASAATVVAQSGKVRRISANALYLIHHVMGGTFGNINDAKAFLEVLTALDSTIENIYAKRSGKDIEKIKELMDANNGDGKWITAQEAKDFGLVDEIFEPMEAAAAVDVRKFDQMGLPIPENYDNVICSEEKNVMKIQIDTSNLEEALKPIKDWMKEQENKENTPQKVNQTGVNNLQNKKRINQILKLKANGSKRKTIS